MARYDFKCPEGHTTEKVMSMKDETQEITCPECQGVSKRIISAVAFHLKGSGFHYTDYVQQNTTAGSED